VTTADDPTAGHFGAPYRWLLAHVGDIDITGHRRPASYYRDIVFGLRHEPSIAVLRPGLHGRDLSATPWAWSDTVGSWSCRRARRPDGARGGETPFGAGDAA